MRRMPIALALAAVTACMAPRYRRPAPAPCSAPVAAIRNNALLAVVNITFTYTPQDEAGARSADRESILDELNAQGTSDGNTFVEPNGQVPNFYFNVSISNDGQDHFTGTMELAGWGQGHINTFYRTQYSYASATKLVQDLADDAYSFIHTGWHDSRPECPQG